MKMSPRNALVFGKRHITLYIIALMLICVMSINANANQQLNISNNSSVFSTNTVGVDLTLKNISSNSHLFNIDKIASNIANHSSTIIIIVIVVVLVLIFLTILTAMQRRYRALYYRSRKIAIKAKNLQAEANLFSVSLNSFNALTWMYDYRTERIYYDTLDPLLIDATKIDSFEKVFTFLHPEDKASFEILINSIHGGTMDNFSHEYRSDFLGEGKYQWWEVRGVKEVRYDEAGESYNAVCGVIININAHKVNESQLTLTAQKASDSERFKREFLTALSHELRIPLNVVLGFTEALVDADNDIDRNRYKDIIKFNGELLNNLITEIMDISKMELGRLNFKYTHFDLAKAFNDIFLSLDKGLHKEIEFILISPYATCYVDYDQHRLAQVLNNFVAHAINSTTQGSITMSYACIDNGIKIEVTDTSAGLTPAEMENAFTLHESSSGLGLYICKTIVEYAKGYVGVDSTVGKGSTFWAWLPCNPQVVHDSNDAHSELAVDNTVHPISEHSNDQQLNVLVADDVQENYLIVKLWLKGHNIDHAINGAEALRMASIKQYDIILMDIKMPIVNGIEATSQIRKFDLTIPIIAVSAHAYGVDRNLASEAGCNDFICKPISKDALLKCIKAHVK